MMIKVWPGVTGVPLSATSFTTVPLTSACDAHDVGLRKTYIFLPLHQVDCQARIN